MLLLAVVEADRLLVPSGFSDETVGTEEALAKFTGEGVVVDLEVWRELPGDRAPCRCRRGCGWCRFDEEAPVGALLVDTEAPLRPFAFVPCLS